MCMIGTEKQSRPATRMLDLGSRLVGIRQVSGIIWILLTIAAGAGCSPRVKVEAPDKPIEINVNVKIEQEVNIKLDKTVEHTLSEHPELFGTEIEP